jgi:hypothetical protein
MCGDPNKPTLLIYPDVGLNCENLTYSYYSSIISPSLEVKFLLLLQNYASIWSLNSHWTQRSNEIVAASINLSLPWQRIHDPSRVALLKKDINTLNV